ANALSGSTITAAVGSLAQVNLDARFTVPGDYEVTWVPAPGTTGWTLAVLQPAADLGGKNVIHVLAAETSSPSGFAEKTIQVRVSPTSGATPPGQATLSVQRSGVAPSSRVFDLAH